MKSGTVGDAEDVTLKQNTKPSEQKLTVKDEVDSTSELETTVVAASESASTTALPSGPLKQEDTVVSSGLYKHTLFSKISFSFLIFIFNLFFEKTFAFVKFLT